MNDIEFHQPRPLLLHCDNQSSITLTKIPCHHDRSKHINIRYHYFHEKVEQGNVMVVYCPIENMVANVLTKALPRPKHMKCLTFMEIIEFHD